MKKLEKFVTEINEKKEEGALENAPINPKDKNLDADKMKGKTAEKNGSKGRWAIDEPTDDDILNDLDPDDWNDNILALKSKFEAKKPFFIQGEAGWGKTSIIKQQAKHYGRTIITVYLDKCEATDLGGTPYVRHGAKGQGVTDVAMPGWCDYIMENEDTPKKKFLLFFDEMNQAQPDVMNALMPIILENTICGYQFDKDFLMIGAAGNLERENRGGVSELSKPLKDRFRPIIIWECDWDAAFKHLHSKYDEKLGADIINKIKATGEVFSSPRTVERGIIEYLLSMKSSSIKDKLTAAKIKKLQLDGLCKDDISRQEDQAIAKLAEEMHAWLNDDGKEDSKRKGSGNSRKDVNMVPQKLKKAIEDGITLGYMRQKEDGKFVKYGISRENYKILLELDDDNSLNAEILDRIVDKLEAEGKSFKFEKDEQWMKAGYKDPQEGD